MRKLLLNLVLLGFTQFVLSQAGCHGISELPENLGSEAFQLDEGDQQNFGSNYQRGSEDSRSQGNGQIVNSRLGTRYSDLMNIYKGRSLQLVRDIDSGQVFWTPSQSVISKPYENDVFS